MAAKNVIATRMALLATKKKIKLAGKGHKLLKEKRDALISEFFAIVDRLKSVRQQAEEELERAFRSLLLAQAVDGVAEIRRAADVVAPMAPLEQGSKTIMGIKVPLFAWQDASAAKGYSLLSTSVELDEAAGRFRQVLGTLVRIAEQEAAVHALAEDIKKTKRKVNALEQILLPRLEEEKGYITMRLEEMERETFGRLKIIKANISA